MITITELTKTYPGNVQALHGLTLNIGAGMFGLVGPNGAGKTTLMRILAGLIQPSSGQVRIFDQDISTPQGHFATQAALGYLPQELGFYPQLTAQEFLDYIARLKGLNDKASRRKQVAETLEIVRLTEVANRPLRTYSGGMKRRVGIAQAILGHPRLLIVDEPTVGLDPEERIRLRNLLAEIATRCIVILSTHIIADIGQSCTALAAIKQGRLLFHGTSQDLMDAAQGKVWTITTTGEPPRGNIYILSRLQTEGQMQYRIVGNPDQHYSATSAEPSLEDGYMWLINQTHSVIM